jgi:glycosidase
MTIILKNCHYRVFRKNSISTSEFANAVTSIINLYRETVNEVQFNLLGSHDPPRILTLSKQNIDKVKLQMIVQFTTGGTPCIYYGDEISITGGQDPGCRKCMIWDERKQDKDMFTLTQKLIKLRKQHKSLRTNHHFSSILASDDENIICYHENDVVNEFLLFINNNAQQKTINVPLTYN